jgi:hypothetical protein
MRMAATRNPSDRTSMPLTIRGAHSFHGVPEMAHLKRMRALKSREYSLLKKALLRRNKLIKILQEQLHEAEDFVAGRTHISYRKVWMSAPDGTRVQIEKPRQVRRWFWVDKQGAFITAWYNSKQLTFNDEATTIYVINKNRIPGAIRQLIRAAEAGELDQALEAVA